MKKVILISASVLFLLNCKKGSNGSVVNSDVYCVYSVLNGKNTLYKCCKTTSEMQQATIDLRNQNKQSTSITKHNCSDC